MASGVFDGGFGTIALPLEAGGACSPPVLTVQGRSALADWPPAVLPKADAPTVLAVLDTEGDDAPGDETASNLGGGPLVLISIVPLDPGPLDLPP